MTGMVTTQHATPITLYTLAFSASLSYMIASCETVAAGGAETARNTIWNKVSCSGCLAR